VELLEKARALRPIVEEHAAETERLTRISEEIHQRFEEAGFYRMLMPARYGGLEIDLPTYVKVWMEVARGDASAAWCGCLAANHSLQLGSWWPERAQNEIFGSDGMFKAASVAAPLSGLARRVEGGWELDGKVSYCSGVPYATHFVGQALTEPPAAGGPPGPPILFVAPRLHGPRRLG
jgi:3-hydroxy-9,10-secoandrosta-1,3,5(10)-triene-9,17-dione monooxygenase